MRCERCGRDFASGLTHCPHCGADAHYGGNTMFYAKASENRLTVLDLFNGAFKKHPKGAGAKLFTAGTPTTTPSPDRMLIEWTKPWLFVWVMGVGLVFGILLYILTEMGYLAGMFSLMSLGCLIVPVGLLIFYWEINIPRDIPLYSVLLIFLIGGVISLILPDFFGQGGIDSDKAYLAGFTEEPAKLLASALFIYFMDPKYIMGGVLIGASVGAGFACMETISYVMMAFLGTAGSVDVATDAAVELLILRSVLAVGGHITWAAIEAGALVSAKGMTERLSLKHFISPKFLPFIGITIVLHVTWNAEFSILELPVVGDLKFVLLSAAAIFAVFYVIKQGLDQVMAVADGRIPAPRRERQFAGANAGRNGAAGAGQYSGGGAQAGQYSGGGAQAGARPIVRGSLNMLAGPMQGAEFPLHGAVTIGRDPAASNVVLPPGTRGVSRRHCAVELRPDGAYVMDLGSSNGTFSQTGQRLPVNQWVRMDEPFCLGSKEVIFYVQTD